MAHFQLNIQHQNRFSGWTDVEVSNHANVASIVKSCETRRGLDFVQEIALKQFGWPGAIGGVQTVELFHYNDDDVIKLKVNGAWIEKRVVGGEPKKIEHPFSAIFTMMDEAPAV